MFQTSVPVPICKLRHHGDRHGNPDEFNTAVRRKLKRNLQVLEYLVSVPVPYQNVSSFRACAITGTGTENRMAQMQNLVTAKSIYSISLQLTSVPVPISMLLHQGDWLGIQ